MCPQTPYKIQKLEKEKGAKMDAFSFSREKKKIERDEYNIIRFRV